MRPPDRAKRSRTTRTSLAVTTLLTGALILGACGSSTNTATQTPGKNISIVALGDSIASGEGINYGFQYASKPLPHWYGGNPNPTWNGPYQLCHQSSLAYGDLVAAHLDATFTNLACTGSTYENGIVGPRYNTTSTGSVIHYAPAQFGNWETRQNLNAAYTAAHPSLVLVTFGADDVHFVNVIESCVAASITDSNQCTAADPGPTIQNDVLNHLGTLKTDYRSLVSAIQARGAASRPRKVPYIVFTTYANPLPAPGTDLSVAACPDAAHLTAAQTAYLTTLLLKVDATLVSAVSKIPGVSVANIDNALAGHRLCSPDPWAYGPSILLTDHSANAPYHPTPQGQRAIASVVLRSIPSSLSR